MTTLFPLPETTKKLPELKILQEAEKEFNQAKLNKDLHPVFLVKDEKRNGYFVTRFSQRKSIASYENFKVILSTETNNN